MHVRAVVLEVGVGHILASVLAPGVGHVWAGVVTGDQVSVLPMVRDHTFPT